MIEENLKIKQILACIVEENVCVSSIEKNEKNSGKIIIYMIKIKLEHNNIN